MTSLPRKTLKVGIASYEDMKARTMAVARGELRVAATALGDAAWPRLQLTWQHPSSAVVAAVREALWDRVSHLAQTLEPSLRDAETTAAVAGLDPPTPYRAAALLDVAAARGTLAEAVAAAADSTAASSGPAVPLPALAHALLAQLARAGTVRLPASALPASVR